MGLTVPGLRVPSPSASFAGLAEKADDGPLGAKPDPVAGMKRRGAVDEPIVEQGPLPAAVVQGVDALIEEDVAMVRSHARIQGRLEGQVAPWVSPQGEGSPDHRMFMAAEHQPGRAVVGFRSRQPDTILMAGNQLAAQHLSGQVVSPGGKGIRLQHLDLASFHPPFREKPLAKIDRAPRSG